MKRRSFVMALAGAGVQCLPSRTEARPSSPLDTLSAPAGFAVADGYKLVKNWDFRRDIRSANDLKGEFHTRYIYAEGTLDHVGDEWTRYRDNENHVFVPEGLALVARLTGRFQPGQVESGMLRSRWVGQYGVFETRMKVPKGRGTWPAFWLNPQDMRWPPEIDVVEIVDNGRDDTRGSFHFLHGIGAKDSVQHLSKLGSNLTYRPGFDYADDFHTFSVEWSPASVRHFVDGVLISDQTYRWVHDDGADAGPAHILLNLAVGGHWPGTPAPSALPARLVVDHIRVWQR